MAIVYLIILVCFLLLPFHHLIHFFKKQKYIISYSVKSSTAYIRFLFLILTLLVFKRDKTLSDQILTVWKWIAWNFTFLKLTTTNYIDKIVELFTLHLMVYFFFDKTYWMIKYEIKKKKICCFCRKNDFFAMSTTDLTEFCGFLKTITLSYTV